MFRSKTRKSFNFLPILFLLIHGGAWVSGEKESMNSNALQFANSGFAAISMNYRLANDNETCYFSSVPTGIFIDETRNFLDANLK